MTKRFGLVALSLLVVSVLASAGDEAKSVELTGFITDAWCGKGNANVKGAECARSCASKGSDLVIYADGKIYKLDDKEEALKHLGYEVLLKGTLMSGDHVTITSITKADPKS